MKCSQAEPNEKAATGCLRRSAFKRDRAGIASVVPKGASLKIYAKFTLMFTSVASEFTGLTPTLPTCFIDQVSNNESQFEARNYGRSAMSVFLFWLLIILVATYLIVAMLYPDKF